MRSAYGGEASGISEYPATIVVDVANVMGSRPDGWWKDRAGAAVRLYAGLVRLAANGGPALPDDTGPRGDSGPEFVMVLEGAARAGAGRMDADPSSRVRVVQATGSGDDAIVAQVRELRGPGGSRDRVIVVTADRELRRRCVAAGATILGPSWLRGLLDRE